MSRTFDTLGNDTVDLVFDNLGFQACGNCRGRSSSLSGIMQIVTSAVRIDVALTLSRRRSLFAPPNSCGTLVVLAHADAQSLCAAGACSLSEPWWLDQFTAQRQGTTAFSDASEIFFMCHVLDCHKQKPR